MFAHLYVINFHLAEPTNLTKTEASELIKMDYSIRFLDAVDDVVHSIEFGEVLHSIEFIGSVNVTKPARLGKLLFPNDFRGLDYPNSEGLNI